MGKGGIPDRWLPYSPMGSVVPGTRFIACKVPLNDGLLKRLPPNERFGPRNLIEACPKIGLLIDLTNTTRYYFTQEFTDERIQYEKIYCPGQVVPPNSIVKKFYQVVDDYLASEEDPDAVIVVHCTHGVNRTGYFICRYMIERLNMSPEEAIKNFQKARGHGIERDTYVNDLRNGCKGGNESDLRFVPYSAQGRNQRRTDTHHTNNYRRRGFDTNSTSNEWKRRRFENKHNYNDDSNRGFESQNSRSRYFPGNDRQRRPEEDSRYMHNWRHRDNHPSDSSTTPLPQFTPHQQPHQPHIEPPSYIRTGDSSRGFNPQPKFSFSSQHGEARDFQSRTGDSNRSFNPMPKFSSSSEPSEARDYQSRTGDSNRSFNPMPKFSSSSEPSEARDYQSRTGDSSRSFNPMPKFSSSSKPSDARDFQSRTGDSSRSFNPMPRFSSSSKPSEASDFQTQTQTSSRLADAGVYQDNVNESNVRHTMSNQERGRGRGRGHGHGRSRSRWYKPRRDQNSS
ncbi:putative uncharacterized protein DDB_G0279653 [Macrosteles quadrilineatus]|uniref:putative uncharacterized protein DDB_G0279653 n=1 Tax=Macrosteles quadrilineatus TaxID=74068 RepID=UPI0023E340B4|nr:putative uncharacterized protein DDB_G0279653 [Macrosteles quadrilineatus]